MQGKIRRIPGGSVDSGALPRLFERYLTGEIADPSWAQIMSILDEGPTTGQERVALASFLNDACTDLGSSDVEVPQLRDVDEFVAMTRAA